MNQHSLLLSSLTQRLALALTMLALLWGVYFWAVSENSDVPQHESAAETVAP